jgi:hypothetical protein
MAPSVFADALALAVLAALIMAGAVTAWTASNAGKRLAGVLVALFAATAALALLGMPAEAMVTTVAIAFAYCVVGVSIMVRLQESYASTEAAEIDAADDGDEPPEPRA